MDGGAWWAAVHRVAKSRTRLSNFTFTFHFHALEKEMATLSSALAWRIPGTGELGGLPSMGSHRVGHDWSDLAAAAVTPKVMCLEWDFIGLIKVKWDHEGRALTWRIGVLVREDTRKLALSLPCEDEVGRWPLRARNIGITRTWPCWHPDLRLLGSRIVRYKILLFKPPSLWYYGTLGWLRHMYCTCPVIKTERKLFSQFWAPRVTQPEGYLDKRHPTTY